MTTSIPIEAPDDVHVATMPVPAGKVSKGQTLFTLTSFATQRFQVQLDLFTQQIAIIEAPFNDGRIDAEINLIKQKAQAYAQIGTNIQTKIKNEWDLVFQQWIKFLPGSLTTKGSSTTTDANGTNSSVTSDTSTSDCISPIQITKIPLT